MRDNDLSTVALVLHYICSGRAPNNERIANSTAVSKRTM